MSVRRLLKCNVSRAGSVCRRYVVANGCTVEGRPQSDIPSQQREQVVCAGRDMRGSVQRLFNVPCWTIVGL
jgi:hypothetical protein